MASVLAAGRPRRRILPSATAAADWPRLTQALCRSVAGSACTPAVYRSALYQAGVTAPWRSLLLAARGGGRLALRPPRAAVAVADPGARAGGAAGRPGAARALPAAARARTVVLDDPRPAAYCVAGRPAAIVVTSGALAVLDQPQLEAVLAHERAHLAQRPPRARHRHSRAGRRVPRRPAVHPGGGRGRPAGRDGGRRHRRPQQRAGRRRRRAARPRHRASRSRSRALCRAAWRRGLRTAGPAPSAALAAAAQAVRPGSTACSRPARPAAAAAAAMLLGVLSVLLVLGPALLSAFAA